MAQAPLPAARSVSASGAPTPFSRHAARRGGWAVVENRATHSPLSHGRKLRPETDVSAFGDALLDKSKLLAPSCAQIVKALCLQLQKCNFATDLPRADATVSHEQLVHVIQQASAAAARSISVQLLLAAALFFP